jgi:uncharacterized protein YraI
MAVGVSVGRCQDNGWCNINYGCISGWSMAARFLAPQVRRTYRVIGVAETDPDGLNVRSGPGVSYSIAGHVSPNAADVIVHSCEANPNDATEWCLISRAKLAGWVAGRFLAPLQEGSPPTPPPIVASVPPPNPTTPPSSQPSSPTQSDACKMFPTLC